MSPGRRCAHSRPCVPRPRAVRLCDAGCRSSSLVPVTEAWRGPRNSLGGDRRSNSFESQSPIKKHVDVVEIGYITENNESMVIKVSTVRGAKKNISSQITDKRVDESQQDSEKESVVSSNQNQSSDIGENLESSTEEEEEKEREDNGYTVEEETGEGDGFSVAACELVDNFSVENPGTEAVEGYSKPEQDAGTTSDSESTVVEQEVAYSRPREKQPLAFSLPTNGGDSTLKSPRLTRSLPTPRLAVEERSLVSSEGERVLSRRGMVRSKDRHVKRCSHHCTKYTSVDADEEDDDDDDSSRNQELQTRRAMPVQVSWERHTHRRTQVSSSALRNPADTSVSIMDPVNSSTFFGHTIDETIVEMMHTLSQLRYPDTQHSAPMLMDRSGPKRLPWWPAGQTQSSTSSVAENIMLGESSLLRNALGSTVDEVIISSLSRLRSIFQPPEGKDIVVADKREGPKKHRSGGERPAGLADEQELKGLSGVPTSGSVDVVNWLRDEYIALATDEKAARRQPRKNSGPLSPESLEQRRYVLDCLAQLVRRKKEIRERRKRERQHRCRSQSSRSSADSQPTLLGLGSHGCQGAQPVPALLVQASPSEVERIRRLAQQSDGTVMLQPHTLSPACPTRSEVTDMRLQRVRGRSAIPGPVPPQACGDLAVDTQEESESGLKVHELHFNRNVRFDSGMSDNLTQSSGMPFTPHSSGGYGIAMSYPDDSTVSTTTCKCSQCSRSSQYGGRANSYMSTSTLSSGRVRCRMTESYRGAYTRSTYSRTSDYQYSVDETSLSETPTTYVYPEEDEDNRKSSDSSLEISKLKVKEWERNRRESRRKSRPDTRRRVTSKTRDSALMCTYMVEGPFASSVEQMGLATPSSEQVNHYQNMDAQVPLTCTDIKRRKSKVKRQMSQYTSPYRDMIPRELGDGVMVLSTNTEETSPFYNKKQVEPSSFPEEDPPRIVMTPDASKEPNVSNVNIQVSATEIIHLRSNRKESLSPERELNAKENSGLKANGVSIEPPKEETNAPSRDKHMRNNQTRSKDARPNESANNLSGQELRPQNISPSSDAFQFSPNLASSSKLSDRIKEIPECYREAVVVDQRKPDELVIDNACPPCENTRTYFPPEESEQPYLAPRSCVSPMMAPVSSVGSTLEETAVTRTPIRIEMLQSVILPQEEQANKLANKDNSMGTDIVEVRVAPRNSSSKGTPEGDCLNQVRHNLIEVSRPLRNVPSAPIIRISHAQSDTQTSRPPQELKERKTRLHGLHTYCQTDNFPLRRPKKEKRVEENSVADREICNVNTAPFKDLPNPEKLLAAIQRAQVFYSSHNIKRAWNNFALQEFTSPNINNFEYIQPNSLGSKREEKLETHLTRASENLQTSQTEPSKTNIMTLVNTAIDFNSKDENGKRDQSCPRNNYTEEVQQIILNPNNDRIKLPDSAPNIDVEGKEMNENVKAKNDRNSNSYPQTNVPKRYQKEEGSIRKRKPPSFDNMNLKGKSSSKHTQHRAARNECDEDNKDGVVEVRSDGLTKGNTGSANQPPSQSRRGESYPWNQSSSELYTTARLRHRNTAEQLRKTPLAVKTKPKKTKPKSTSKFLSYLTPRHFNEDYSKDNKTLKVMHVNKNAGYDARKDTSSTCALPPNENKKSAISKDKHSPVTPPNTSEMKLRRSRQLIGKHKHHIPPDSVRSKYKHPNEEFRPMHLHPDQSVRDKNSPTGESISHRHSFPEDPVRHCLEDSIRQSNSFPKETARKTTTAGEPKRRNMSRERKPTRHDGERALRYGRVSLIQIAKNPPFGLYRRRVVAHHGEQRGKDRHHEEYEVADKSPNHDPHWKVQKSANCDHNGRRMKYDANTPPPTSNSYRSSAASKIHPIRVLWAITRINIFEDNSRTYEVMKPTSKTPRKIPSSTEGLFALKPQSMKSCK